MAFGGRVRMSRATAAQLTVAFFVAAAAVGLPLAWNRAARLRAAEKRESGAAREAAAAARRDALKRSCVDAKVAELLESGEDPATAP